MVRGLTLQREAMGQISHHRQQATLSVRELVDRKQLLPLQDGEPGCRKRIVLDMKISEARQEALNRAPGGENARMIGEVREQPNGVVLVTTRYGGSRIVDMLVGDPLPRIC